jgi:hypothetical protein
MTQLVRAWSGPKESFDLFPGCFWAWEQLHCLINSCRTDQVSWWCFNLPGCSVDCCCNHYSRRQARVQRRRMDCSTILSRRCWTRTGQGGSYGVHSLWTAAITFQYSSIKARCLSEFARCCVSLFCLTLRVCRRPVVLWWCFWDWRRCACLWKTCRVQLYLLNCLSLWWRQGGAQVIRCYWELNLLHTR